jgi:hypothetical protein
MKTKFKLILIAAYFLAIFNPLSAQVSGDDYRKSVLELIPDVNLENKILFINVWQSSNIESRENNKEFLRVSNIYKGAKLKNGLKGVVYVNLSIDKDTYLWMMSIKRDGIVCDYNMENTTGKFDALSKLFGDFTGSVVVGSDGTIIAKDVKQDKCFPLFLSLITR